MTKSEELEILDKAIRVQTQRKQTEIVSSVEKGV